MRLGLVDADHAGDGAGQAGRDRQVTADGAADLLAVHRVHAEVHAEGFSTWLTDPVASTKRLLSGT